MTKWNRCTQDKFVLGRTGVTHNIVGDTRKPRIVICIHCHRDVDLGEMKAHVSYSSAPARERCTIPYEPAAATIKRALLYRFFSAGKIPEDAVAQIEKEGVLLQDEELGT